MDIDVQFFNLKLSKPGICLVCLTQHKPNAPHCQDSLYYQCTFFAKCGRWPTQADTISHCDPKDRFSSNHSRSN